MDSIHNSFRGTSKKPEIIVCEHCAGSSALGSAAVEAVRLWHNGTRTTFIVVDSMRKIEYRTPERRYALQILQE